MPTEPDTDTNAQHTDRYRYVEYESDGTSVSVIQDTENQRAWIQSTVNVAVER